MIGAWLRRAGVALSIGALLTLGGCSTPEPAQPESSAGPDGCAVLKDLVVLAWADSAGLLAQEGSPAAWVRDHPERATFDRYRTEAGAIDVVDVYVDREQRPDPWNHLRRYYDEDGRALLVSTGLDDQVSAPDDGEDVIGWDECPG